MFKNDFYPEALDRANQAFEAGELSSEQHLSEVEAHYLGQLASEQALSEDMDRLEAEYQGLKAPERILIIVMIILGRRIPSITKPIWRNLLDSTNRLSN